MLVRPASSMEDKTWKGWNWNFFEEQKELNIILGCFLAPRLECTGEAMPELCAETGWLMHWSKILL